MVAASAFRGENCRTMRAGVGGGEAVQYAGPENKHIRDVVRLWKEPDYPGGVFMPGGKRIYGCFYRKVALEEIVFREEERSFLAENGYEEERLDQMLIRLGQRFREYRKTQDVSFPHEMGVF